ncbi:LAGLIDADG endonuclease [Pleurocapsa sp. PCC 7319]|uniref:LAGLIDADG endonuclease n=1 Tax=Pleurocapsa sp. PCC 7319 TaxID=118161 RepID=UPI000345EF41|nr:LAGLIDADG endonuclease [Pleurocapsa sp. PCC 7319]
MVQPFNCLVCSKKVEPNLVHPACRRTCGSPECQAIYKKQLAVKADYCRQRNRIEQLKEQDIDLVTCAVCNQQFEMIGYSHLRTHGLTTKEYKILYPNFPVLNSRIQQQRGKEAAGRSHYLNYKGKKPDKELYEFLTGSLLGDGCLERRSSKRNARYAEGGSNQKYLEWKYKFISQYFSCSFNERISSPHTKTGKRYQGWWLRTKVHPVLTELHSQWYSEAKVIPEKLIKKYLTKFALAVWFCDDGCSSGSANFYTMAFSDNEVEFLAALLESRFDLCGSILKNQKNQPFIRLSADSKRKLSKIVSKFSIPGMEYKLDF